MEGMHRLDAMRKALWVELAGPWGASTGTPSRVFAAIVVVEKAVRTSPRARAS